MAYEVSTTEGKTIELTAEQADRYDAGVDVIAEVAASLPSGTYSVYAPDGGPLLQNIVVR